MKRQYYFNQYKGQIVETTPLFDLSLSTDDPYINPFNDVVNDERPDMSLKEVNEVTLTPEEIKECLDENFDFRDRLVQELNLMFQPSNFAEQLKAFTPEVSNSRIAELIWRNMNASTILVILDECQ